MQIEKKQIKDLDRAEYNPRIELIPGDTEYENLRHSISTYGMLIPYCLEQKNKYCSEWTSTFECT